MPSFSVVIPCLNEEKYLGNLLGDLALQTKKPNEVVIADCDSEDKTVEVANSFKIKLNIKIARSKIRTPGAARNAGAKIAKSDYLVFIDADMRIPKNLIAELESGTPKDVIIPRIESDGGHVADRYIIWNVHIFTVFFRRVLHRPYGIGGIICVRKTTHEKIKCFDGSLLSHDDIQYYEKLSKAKASYMYLNDLKIVSSSRRFRKMSAIRGLITLFFENSEFARWIFHPLRTKFGGGRKYGHYSELSSRMALSRSRKFGG